MRTISFLCALGLFSAGMSCSRESAGDGDDTNSGTGADAGEDGGADTDADTDSDTDTGVSLCGEDIVPSTDFVLGDAAYDIPDLARPAKCETYADQLYHTLVARMTDKAADAYAAAGVTNEYSRADPENADGSHAILRGVDGTFLVYDTSDFSVAADITPFVFLNQEPEPRWDPAEPAFLYFLDGMSLKRFDVGDMSSTTIHDFSAEFPALAAAGGRISTGTEGEPSRDGNRFCFMVVDQDGAAHAFVSYDRQTDAVLGTMTAAGLSDTVNWASISATGAHCVLGFDLGGATSYTGDFASHVDIAVMPGHGLGHSDFAVTTDGRDVTVFQDIRTDFITMGDLETGELTELVHIPFEVNPDIGLHFSGHGPAGWVLVSTSGAKNPPSGSSRSWMDTSLFFLELGGAHRVLRVASTYTYQAIDYTGESNYFAEAFASTNRVGTRVYWGANFGQGDLTSQFEVMVAILPEGWPALLP
ncbi:MAG: hypothetical protein PHU25_21295 [Deltaproteobacteria bacterium]|nr:hypothetical protein [Deltaproteobacteria bacterium]